MSYSHFRYSFILILLILLYLLFVCLYWMHKKERLIGADAKLSLSIIATQSSYNYLKIVMPFHISQVNNVLENINTWNKFKPCESIDSQTKVELIFYVGYFKSNLTELYAKLPQNMNCFCKVSTTLHKYDTQTDEQYIIGSRLMFESMLKKRYESFKNTSFVFYMEPDVRPIRSNWLNSICQEIGAGHFWLKGSVYRGDINKFAKSDPYYANYVHINGNAIYNIGNKDLVSFYFDKLRPYVVNTNGDSKYAYDTDFFEFILDKNNYDITRRILHQFQFTELVQNYWHTKYNITEMAENFKLTFFIHGKFPIY